MSFFSKTSTLIIAEIAQAHDGSLGMAHAYLDAVADAGADAVKFQTHIAAAESTPGEPWRVKFSRQDASRYDYWQRMEFSETHWQGLADHARERGLLFLSSPFSPEAVVLLERVGVAAWKIASGEVTNTPMFEQMAETGLPFLLSTGMSRLAEIDAAVDFLHQRKLEFAVLQCTSMYPTPADKIGLNLLAEFADRYDCLVGLSDHSGLIYPPLAAATLGASVIEVHVTFSRQMFGPDVPASLTTTELAQLVEGVRCVENMQAHQISKDEMADELSEMRRLFTKSVVARTDLPAGTVLRREHLAIKKPGGGLPADQLTKLLGRTLQRSVAADRCLMEEDLAQQ